MARHGLEERYEEVGVRSEEDRIRRCGEGGMNVVKCDGTGSGRGNAGQIEVRCADRRAHFAARAVRDDVCLLEALHESIRNN
jgi:hypothetical protein